MPHSRCLDHDAVPIDDARPAVRCRGGNRRRLLDLPHHPRRRRRRTPHVVEAQRSPGRADTLAASASPPRGDPEMPSAPHREQHEDCGDAPGDNGTDRAVMLGRGAFVTPQALRRLLLREAAGRDLSGEPRPTRYPTRRRDTHRRRGSRVGHDQARNASPRRRQHGRQPLPQIAHELPRHLQRGKVATRLRRLPPHDVAEPFLRPGPRMLLDVVRVRRKGRGHRHPQVGVKRLVTLEGDPRR